MRQVHLMNVYGTTVLVGFADYLSKLADVARNEGFGARDRLLSNYLRSHRWRPRDVYPRPGAALRFATSTASATLDLLPPRASRMDFIYGKTPISWRSLTRMIDAHRQWPSRGTFASLLCSRTTSSPTSDSIRMTCPRSRSRAGPLDWTYGDCGAFSGRSDDMVKLRGISNHPTAVGEILKLAGDNTGEFFCRVQQTDGRDNVIVSVESAAAHLIGAAWRSSSDPCFARKSGSTSASNWLPRAILSRSPKSTAGKSPCG